MANGQCNSCGAATKSLVCEYCGSTTQLIMDLQMQKEALAEFHKILQKQTKSIKAKMLRNGFLPDAPEVLIEAGLHTIALINPEGSTNTVVISAAQRLRAIITKLKLMEPTAKTQAAVAEFESVRLEYERADRVSMWVGIGMFGAVGLFVCLIFVALAIFFG